MDNQFIVLTSNSYIQTYLLYGFTNYNSWWVEKKALGLNVLLLQLSQQTEDYLIQSICSDSEKAFSLNIRQPPYYL